MLKDSNYQIGLLNAMNAKLIKDDAISRLLIEKSGCAYAYHSFAERRTECFGDWEKYFGFSAEKYISVSQITDLVEDSFTAELYECLMLESRNKERETVEFKLSTSNMWIELETNVVYDDNRKPVEKVLCFRDITKYRQINDELSYMAYYDAMTGLLNRNYFVKTLGNMIEKSERENCIVSVLFMDIDDFRRINDGMGILIGDETVQRFGEILRELVNDNIRISHFNGDIFCIAIFDPCGERSVDRVIKRIRDRLSNPLIMTNGAEISLSISIGVAECPEASKDPMELINLAEIVMFKSKHKGKNGTQYFDQPIIQEFIENLEIEQKMEKAIKAGNFFMCYQPQYDTNSKNLRGIEALVRWRGEDGQVVNPGKFIPIAEKNGAILQLGEFIIEQSLSDFAGLIEKYGQKDIILSINISAIQFKSKNFVNYLISMIKKYSVPPTNIELEITESAFIDDMSDVICKMNILRDMGIRFSMDDFGTGFSSLSYLRQLPIDTLKIDKSFVDTVVTDGPTRTIAEAIIDLSKKLGFDTIAEGVEEEVQYSLLKNIGCENIQGFLFGRPMDMDDIDTLYKESN